MNLELLLYEIAEGKVEVGKEGLEPTVVVGHYAEALFERSTMITGGGAFGKIICKDHLTIVGLGCLCQYIEAPIEVAREAIGEVVIRDQSSAGIKRLVADDHTT